MEFPNLGQQCSWRECKQLDFLPVTCDNCRQIFCKEHYLTSAHDCKCLNEFFKKQTSIQTTEAYVCNHKECQEKSPIELLCKFCKVHFCISHRHHGCRDDLLSSERKKQQVEEWKKPKEQFKIAKALADKKVEQALRKAASTQLQPLALKVRLMKIKNKAFGDNKIPIDNRLYFSVLPPWIDENTHYKAVPLFTSKQWSVGRTIDLFSKKLKVDNKNNEVNEPKLRLFKLSDGSLISKTTDVLMESLIDSVIVNGDSLILNYVKVNELSDETCITGNILEKYQLAAVQ